MTVLKINAFNDVDNLTKSLDKIYNDMPHNFALCESVYPKIDISEDEKNLYFEAELPGLDKKDVSIKLENNVLNIKGEPKTKNSGGNKSVIRNERLFGSFNRSFSLEEEIDPDSATAEFTNGILTVTIEKLSPKSKGEKVISVK